MKYYFVSYAHSNGFGYAFASSFNFFNIDNFKKGIPEKHIGTTGIIVLNYKEISKKEHDFNVDATKT